MKVQLFTCLLLLLVAGVFSLPTQVDENSKAVEISNSVSSANSTNTDLAEICTWEVAYRIRGPRISPAVKAIIDNGLTAFFNRLCDLL